MSANDETLKVNIYPTGNAFTRNPIFLSVSSVSMATYSIRMNDEEIFKGNGTGDFKVNISEIVETGIKTVPVLRGGTESITGITGLFARADIHVENEGAEEADLFFTAWAGGISKKDFKRLRTMGTDIFTLKFLNPYCNFFFTTRSADWKIAVRETELFPLPFIFPSSGEEVSVTELTGKNKTIVEGTPGNLYALDIAAIRRAFFFDNGILACCFDVRVGENFACRIAVEQSRATKERYLLRFLNSYGAYELLEVQGKASVTPQFPEEGEGATFSRYDEITDDFNQERKRPEIQNIITVGIGYRRSGEIPFLLDLLSSDDVTLLGYGEDEIRVIPSVEEFSFMVHPEEPKDITLKLTFTETESNYTPDITENGFNKPRIHSKQFSKQFN